MVRLVFRPYTQIWRTICTSVPLRASTRVSSGFTLFRHSSPSFGSQQIRSYSNLSKENPDRSIMRPPVSGQALTSVDQVYLYFHFASRVCHPKTRAYVRLLGPCFKTGRLKPFRQHHKRRYGWPPPLAPALSRHIPCGSNKTLQTPWQEPPSQRQRCVTSVQLMSQIPGLTLLAQLPSKHPYPTSQTDADPLTTQVHPQTAPTMNLPGLRSEKPTGHGPQIDCIASTADFNRFHFNGFTCYLTLFSKCFSSFPRGTCSLSVSCLYLALDEIYHPF